MNTTHTQNRKSLSNFSKLRSDLMMAYRFVPAKTVIVNLGWIYTSSQMHSHRICSSSHLIWGFFFFCSFYLISYMYFFVIYIYYSYDAVWISFFPTFVCLFCVENILKQFFSTEFTLKRQLFYYGWTILTFSYLTADTEIGNVDTGRHRREYCSDTSV